jgi:hypothetical protein
MVKNGSKMGSPGAKSPADGYDRPGALKKAFFGPFLAFFINLSTGGTKNRPFFMVFSCFFMVFRGPAWGAPGGPGWGGPGGAPGGPGRGVPGGPGGPGGSKTAQNPFGRANNGRGWL